MSNQFAGLNLYTRSFGIAGIHGFDICRSNNSAFITRVVDHQLVALLHRAEMFNGGGIGYTIPDGGVIFLQIGKAVHGGFSFEEVVHCFSFFGSFIPSEAREPYDLIQSRGEIYSGNRRSRSNSKLRTRARARTNTVVAVGIPRSAWD